MAGKRDLFVCRDDMELRHMHEKRQMLKVQRK